MGRIEELQETTAERRTLLDLALLLAENARILVAIPLAAGVLALIIAFLIPPTFTATTRILPPVKQQGAAAALIGSQLGGLAGFVSGAAGLRNPADQYVALLKSHTVLDAIIRRFKLQELYGKELMEDARKALDGQTRVFSGLREGIITVEVDDHDPKRAADMANAFVEELRNLSKGLALTEAAQRRLFFEMQLQQAKDNLTKAEVALRASGVSEGTLKVMPQAALDSLARLKAQITAQEIKLASMRTFMTESNPDLKLAAQELAALRSEMAKAEQSGGSGASGNGAEYIAKYRDFKYHETLFELMAKQYEAARLDEARDADVIQVVDPAQPPERKSKPRRGLTAVMTTITVFFLVLFFVFVRRGYRTLAASPGSAEKIARLKALLRRATSR